MPRRQSRKRPRSSPQPETLPMRPGPPEEPVTEPGGNSAGRRAFPPEPAATAQPEPEPPAAAMRRWHQWRRRLLQNCRHLRNPRRKSPGTGTSRTVGGSTLTGRAGGRASWAAVPAGAHGGKKHARAGTSGAIGGSTSTGHSQPEAAPAGAVLCRSPPQRKAHWNKSPADTATEMAPSDADRTPSTGKLDHRKAQLRNYRHR